MVKSAVFLNKKNVLIPLLLEDGLYMSFPTKRSPTMGRSKNVYSQDGFGSPKRVRKTAYAAHFSSHNIAPANKKQDFYTGRPQNN